MTDGRTRAWRPELLWLSLASLLTHLWGLTKPEAVVWDEVHFEGFASRYFTGIYYFDVHPPLGKLLLAASAWLLRIPTDTLSNVQPAPMLRVLPALAGAAIIPLMYVLLLRLGAGRRIATLGALAVLCENALLVESRLILMDGLLVCFGLAAVVGWLTARERSGGARWGWVVCTGLAAGAAASVKWTGLAALGAVLAAWFVEAVVTRALLRRAALEGATIVALTAVVYVGQYVPHVALLTRNGPDAPLMSERFQATLTGNPHYDPAARMPFLAKVAELNRVSQQVNEGWATDKHPSASPWYTWPIAKHSFGLWEDLHTPYGYDGWIILVGNPVVWWGALVGLAVLAWGLARRRAELVAMRAPLAFLAFSYLLNFVPFAFIKRPMYLYHYFFALLYSIALAVLASGLLFGWREADVERPWAFATARAKRSYLGVALLVAVSFAFFAPLSYGWAMSKPWANARYWVLERHFWR